MNEMTRRGFLQATGAAGVFAAIGCFGKGAKDAFGEYSIAVLGDTHYDTEPESFYHSHYDESNKWAKVQHAEFRRNGEMWRDRCPRLVAASGALAASRPTSCVLQLGDLVQGDCDDVPTHKKMMADCIDKICAAYPSGMPFLTVVGNHDFRGKGANEAYFDFAEPFMTDQIAKLGAKTHPAGWKAKYPAFSFRLGDDLWVFCHFETRNLDPITDLIEADQTARHVFLVTHGPFTPSPDPGFRWRLGGKKECEAGRARLYETLSRRHAIVLSGHTHTTCYFRHENRFGGFAEMTVNSVWKDERLATVEPIFDKVENFDVPASGLSGDKLEECRRTFALFKPGLKEYFYNAAAGHYRLNVSSGSVDVEFYPGAARECARVFRMA